MIRKSLTLDDENNVVLNTFRGRLLSERGIDLDFTRAVNMLIALGIYRMANFTISEEENKIVNKYLFGFKELEMAAISDIQWDKWFEYEYPKILKQISRMQRKTQSDSGKGKKKEGTPEQEQSV